MAVRANERGDVMSMIEFKNVYKEFVLPTETVRVLNDVSFAIPENSFTVIYGPSGSGKSTLLNTLVGLEPPTSGNVQLNSQELYAMNADQRANFRARLVGMVYQTNYWVNSLTVLENVAMPLYLSGYNRREAASVALESLSKIGMEEYRHSNPTVLSGGQQQRVSIARALAGDPQLIVADEPTGNLDTKNGDMIMSMLYELRHRLGKTVVMVTHNLSYLPLSDLRLHLKDGVVNQETGDFGLAQTEKQDIMQKFQESLRKVNNVNKTSNSHIDGIKRSKKT